MSLESEVVKVCGGSARDSRLTTRDFPRYSGTVQSPHNDAQLVQIVDAAVADAARRSGDWLVCRPGCTQCCVGPFAISDLDAARLRRGMEELERDDPRRAARVRRRARGSVARLQRDFPGDPQNGVLDPDREAEFADFANDEPCPALDLETGLCDVYAARPLTCRTFGPPLRTAEGLGVCELCYHGATDAQIAACEVKLHPDALENSVRKHASRRARTTPDTIVAYVLAK